MSLDEEKIWQSIQQRDSQAFERYYKEHYRFFFLAACKYLRDASLAQEVINDVFLRLWQNAGKIIIQSSLRSYLYRAIVNACLNELDRTKKDRQHRQELSHLGEGIADAKEMETGELKVRLYQAIDQLPEQCRKVFRMSRFEGLKQQEIADRLGISIKTVKNHMTNALQQLGEVHDQWKNSPP